MTKEQVKLIRELYPDKIIKIHLDNEKFLYVNAASEYTYFDDTNEMLVCLRNYVYSYRNEECQMTTGFYGYDVIQRIEIDSSYSEGIDILTKYNEASAGTFPNGVTDVNKAVASIQREASVM